VPALGLPDGTILTQSVAILEYLEELYPDPPLLPKDPASRCKVRALTEIVTCDIQPLQGQPREHPLNIKRNGRLIGLLRGFMLWRNICKG